MAGVSGVDSVVLGGLYSSAAMREAFSDLARVQAMLDVEAALARAEAAVGVIPASAAEPIAAACDASRFDLAEMGRQTPLGGVPTIPLVKMLTAAVDGEARRYVHWGATSQDIIDTGMMLQLRKGLDILDADLILAADAAARLADAHRRTAMVGRTLLQHALPIPFGLKAAGWLGLAGRAVTRLRRLREGVLMVQFGGAAGNLAALDDKGVRVMEHLAGELGLGIPEMPWHTARDRLVEITSAVAIAAGAMGKIATDIALLMQTEVGEVAEPAEPGKGGSSTMPHKRNPVGCAAAVAAAVQAEARLPIILGAMRQEHERSIGLWHSEWAAVAELFALAGGATSQVAAMLAGLTVDADRMRANLDLTRGLVFAEAASFALAARIGKQEAHKKVEAASRMAVDGRRHLRDVLAEDPEIGRMLSPTEIAGLFDPDRAFGAADEFITRAIAAWRSAKTS